MLLSLCIKYKKNLFKTFNYNKVSKIDFYNIYANYRILPFIANENDNIKKFLDLIQEKYSKLESWKNYKKFKDYFKLQWIKKISIEEWNIYNISKLCYENNTLDKIFFTNNIVESCNIWLNKNIINNQNNTVNKFNIQINKIINLYFTSGKYRPPIFSKVKAIISYIIKNKFNDNLKLINYLELRNWFKSYRNDLFTNKKIDKVLDISKSSTSLNDSENEDENHYHKDNYKNQYKEINNINNIINNNIKINDDNCIDNDNIFEINNNNINMENNFKDKNIPHDKKNNNISKYIKYIMLKFFILYLDNDNTSKSVKNKKRKKSYKGNIDSLIDISVYENNEIFELNMHLFDKFIE